MKPDEPIKASPGWAMVDVVAVERQARAMQAQAIAELLRAGWRRLSGWLRRAPAGQTA